MNKVFFSISIFLFLFLASSCQKKLDPVNTEGEVSFLIRLPSVALAQFEARCVTEDVFIDQVIIQSPSSFRTTEEFDHTRFAKDKVFLVGNQAAEDGTWLITFVGKSALTNKSFRQFVPYDMMIETEE